MRDGQHGLGRAEGLRGCWWAEVSGGRACVLRGLRRANEGGGVGRGERREGQGHLAGPGAGRAEASGERVKGGLWRAEGGCRAGRGERRQGGAG